MVASLRIDQDSIYVAEYYTFIFDFQKEKFIYRLSLLVGTCMLLNSFRIITVMCTVYRNYNLLLV